MSSAGFSGAVAALARTRWQPWVSLVVRLGLATVWVLAGWAKVGDRLAAQRAVRAYDVLPEPVVVVVGTALPYVELGLAVLLLLGLATRLAAGVSGILLIAFVAGIAQAWARGLRIDCGCFGGGGVNLDVTWTTYALEILRDGGFLLLALWLVLLPRSVASVDAFVAGPPLDADDDASDELPDGAPDDQSHSDFDRPADETRTMEERP
jgi:uncharacterized membrane protein YphA (DoxX/SURF4 family)